MPDFVDTTPGAPNSAPASDPRDRARIRRHFDRAAASYADAAVLHAEVEQRVMERLEWVKFEPRRILDVGCGPGRGTARLRGLYPKSDIIAVDLSENMLREARLAHEPEGLLRRVGQNLGLGAKGLRCVCADMAALPLADDGVDLLYSGISLQWAADPAAVLAEFRRVLSPGGLLMFTTLGPDTLMELRAAWSEADGFEHVNRFVDLRDLGDLMLAAGFQDPVTDVERFTLEYDSAKDVMADLRAIGADTVLANHRPGLMGKGRIRAMTEAYERRRVDGKLPATWEVVYGSGWRGVAKPGQAAVAFQGLG